eukprot:TRINITY_DN109813_c0_g1_i1.p1 TRINITY_DN109813_c0_g1~~TRINITY_DN109813_c0_g1_i1.p1  ORF type:complete len:453 (+),score=76.59 TRINITY_DN109813_c0_g1_i1:65-1423(+)
MAEVEVAARMLEETHGEINARDTVYILACLGLVQFMTPGLALFYAGMVRTRSTTDMLLQNFVALGILTLQWYFIGFSLCFGQGNNFYGGFEYFMWNGVKKHEPWPATKISMELFAIFQCMFAVITPILITGTIADRMRFGPFLFFICAWSILVYYPWCHMIWGGGLFQKASVWDFAGGIVVHTSAGWSALAAALALGPRKHILDGTSLAEPHSIPIIVAGTGILWFGWFGFNGGSSLGVSEITSTAVVNTHIAAATATFVWGMVDWAREGKAKLVPLCIACVAGLVVVTPSCGYIEPHEAIWVGVWAGTVCYGAIMFLNKIGVDDALDVWGVHGVGGATGTILIGVLADGPECLKSDAPESCVFPGSVAHGMDTIIRQATGVGVCIVWSFVATFALIKIMMAVVPVKPTDAEQENIDEALHGEPAYIMSSLANAKGVYEPLSQSVTAKTSSA